MTEIVVRRMEKKRARERSSVAADHNMQWAWMLYCWLQKLWGTAPPNSDIKKVFGSRFLKLFNHPMRSSNEAHWQLNCPVYIIAKICTHARIATLMHSRKSWESVQEAIKSTNSKYPVLTLSVIVAVSLLFWHNKSLTYVFKERCLVLGFINLKTQFLPSSKSN